MTDCTVADYRWSAWTMFKRVKDYGEAARLKRCQTNLKKGKQAKIRKRARRRGVFFDVLVRQAQE